MSDETLQKFINALINGTITEAEHQSLQIHLKEDATARATFRERMDIEAGLRTWAADSGTQRQVLIRDSAREKSPANRLGLAHHVGRHGRFDPGNRSLVDAAIGSKPTNLAGQQNQTTPQATQPTAPPLGKWIAQADCVWQQPPSLPDGMLGAGMIKLTSGAAELQFDSGRMLSLKVLVNYSSTRPTQLDSLPAPFLSTLRKCRMAFFWKPPKPRSSTKGHSMRLLWIQRRPRSMSLMAA
jgi:hypothetical protein